MRLRSSPGSARRRQVVDVVEVDETLVLDSVGRLLLDITAAISAKVVDLWY